MDSKGFVEIQREGVKLLKVTTIVPYMIMSGPIIEEIDMNDYSQEEKAVVATAIFKMKMQ